MSHYRDSDLEILIAGGGRVGFEIATLVLEYGHRPIVIERNPDRVSELRADQNEYITIVEGDATDQSTLEKAGLADCDVVLALTNDTETNLRVCENAPDKRTVARIDQPPETVDQPDSIDAVVYPERAGARAAINQAFGQPIQPIADVTTKLELVQIEAAEGAPAAGMTLSEILIPTEATVISDVETEELADGETVIQPGHRYLIGTHPDVLDDLKKLFRG